MVVMSKTGQTEYPSAEIKPVWVAKPRQIEGADDDVPASKENGQERALLKVVAYPWGVEFEVCEAGVP
jgi:hypothetical protein